MRSFLVGIFVTSAAFEVLAGTCSAFPEDTRCDDSEERATIPERGDLLFQVSAVQQAKLVTREDDCAGEWQQCGGKEWKGAGCCKAGLECAAQNEWYSQCLQPSTTTTAVTIGAEAGLEPCSLPAGTADFSLITSGDAIITAHEVYRGIAIGGALLDGSPNESGNIASHCPTCPMTVGSCAQAACGGAPDYDGGTFNFHGKDQKPQVGAPLPVDFEEFRDLARRARNGTYPGSGSCAEFSVYVVTSGGKYSLSDFCRDPNGCQPEDNGCTLVIFSTSDHVFLSNSTLGRQFGPSVIAPFSEVTPLSEAGYVDGFIVAQSLEADADELGGQLAIHGDGYGGPIFCQPTTTTTTSPRRGMLGSETEGWDTYEETICCR